MYSSFMARSPRARTGGPSRPVDQQQVPHWLSSSGCRPATPGPCILATIPTGRDRHPSDRIPLGVMNPDDERVLSEARDDRATYWEQYYSARSTPVRRLPSQFATFVAGELNRPHRVIEPAVATGATRCSSRATAMSSSASTLPRPRSRSVPARQRPWARPPRFSWRGSTSLTSRRASGARAGLGWSMPVSSCTRSRSRRRRTCSTWRQRSPRLAICLPSSTERCATQAAPGHGPALSPLRGAGLVRGTGARSRLRRGLRGGGFRLREVSPGRRIRRPDRVPQARLVGR